MKPHARQLSVVLFQHIANSVEPLVELVQQRLVLGVVGPLCHHIHVVEGEELELGTDEVVLAGLSGHDVCQLQAIPHLGGPVQTDSQQAEEQHNHNHLEAEDGSFINQRTAHSDDRTVSACINYCLSHAANSEQVRSRNSQITPDLMQISAAYLHKSTEQRHSTLKSIFRKTLALHSIADMTRNTSG